MNAADAIARVLGRLGRLEPLGGGCVGSVYAVHTAAGERWVAKVDESAAADGDGSGRLDVEGFMLDYLREHTELPVPRVRHAEPSLLILEHLPGSTGCAGAAEVHAAELLAALHGVTADRCGFPRDTLIGGLPQPNDWTGSWLEFFARHRLLFMAALAMDAGRLPPEGMRRIEAVAGRLERFIEEPPVPVLVHGDVWSGNVLSAGGRVTGFIDPAIYFGHPEVELAFITMFHTFGERFFGAYRARRALEVAGGGGSGGGGGGGDDIDGFWSTRRFVYMLYPLLVHVRLFGGSYLGDLYRCTDRLVGAG